MESQGNRLVVASAAWADTIPKWLLDKVETERMMYGLMDVSKGKKTVGDAEVCVYLYTYSLISPMHYEYSQIYLKLSSKLMADRIGAKNLPGDFAKYSKTELSSDEKRMLAILKEDLWRKRGGHIQHPILNALRELKKHSKKKV